MCYRSPGPRCSNHAAKKVEAAYGVKMRNPYDREAKAAYDRALDEWNTTPDGIQALRDAGKKEQAEAKAEERKAAIAAYRASVPKATGQSVTRETEPSVTPLHSYVRKFHMAPVSEEGNAPLHDLTDLYPADVLDHPEHYGARAGTGREEMLAQLRRAQGNPNAVITIYRALPKGQTHINRGDWIALSEGYARYHLESSLDDNHHIIKTEVPASTIWSEGNDLSEWGYDGQMVETSPTKGASVPAPAPKPAKTHPASDPASSYYELDHWMRSEDSEVRAAVARNASTHPSLLRKAAKDEEESVRLATASNERTPSDALLTLANDASEEVREAVVANPNAPTYLLSVLNR